MNTMDEVEEPWFSVRCVFSHPSDTDGQTLYEERVTLWRAGSFDEAVQRAEAEAKEYAENLDMQYVGLAQAYHLAVADAPSDGDEVFSLFRSSGLPSAEYLSRFFDTGDERQAR